MEHLDFRKTSIGGIKPNPKLLGLAVVEVNPTELCNRTCSFCPRYDSTVYPNKNLNMTVETAKTLDSQLKLNGFKGYICIAGYGEPLLNPHILKIIETLSDHFIELITNADPILSGKHNIQSIVDAGVDRIMFSDYDSNEKLEEIAKEWPMVRIRKFIDDGLDHYEDYGFNNRAGAMFSIEKPLLRPCYIPSYKTMIDWNGNMLLCSHDWSKQTIFGNINETDISKIWNSDNFISMRKELIAGNRHLFKACSKCNVKGDIMGQEYAELWTK
jgi:radical SAM protein with 4Fe4S-binding SPASM domain